MSFHTKGSSFCRRFLKSGLAIHEKYGMYAEKYTASPKKVSSFLWSFGASSSHITLSFSWCVNNPSHDTMLPSTTMLQYPKWHLGGESVKPDSAIALSTTSTCFKCSSKVFEYTTMSLMYTSMNIHKKGDRISCIAH